MLTTKIRLLKQWTNDGIEYKEGQLLKTDESSADGLVEQGIAEVYEPKKGDIVVAADDDGGLSTDDIQKVVKETVQNAIKENKGFHGEPPEEKLDKKGGFNEFWQFASAIYRAGPAGRNADEKLQKWDALCRTKTTGYMEENDQSQGGYLVPTEFRNQILETAIETNILRPLCTVIPMSSSSIKIPYVRDVAHGTSTHGGIIIYRPDELAQLTETNATYGQIELSLHRLAGLCHLSNDILEDSPISLQPIVTRQFGEAIAWQEMDDYINGTGANMALGVLNAPCTVDQAKETGQPATTIETANIVNMYSRMNPKSIAKAVWLANNDTFPQLAQLTLNVGTGGSAVGLVRSIESAPYMSILGRPLYLTEHCQTLGTSGDILFGDWSQYLVGQRTGGSAVKVASSIHLKFDYDITSFRFIMRYDGQPWWPAAFTPVNSTATLSPFVTLATRS